MKLKSGYTTHTVAGEQMMVAVGPAAEAFHGIVRSNKTAAFIINCLKEETTEESITEKLLEEYDIDRDTAAKDVHALIAKIRETGAIED